MTDNNDNLPNSDNNLEQVKTSRPKNNVLFIGLTGVIACIALLLAAFALFTSFNEDKNKATQYTALSSQIERLSHDHTTVQKQSQGNALAIQSAQNAFKTQLAGLEQQLSTLNTTPIQANWELQKARYYLELAQINTYWTTDFNTSVALLQQSDLLLKPFDEPKIFDIRQAIANEIAQLKAIPSVDTIGLLSKVEATQTLVNQLQVQPLAKKNIVPTEQKSDTSNWPIRFQDSMNALEKLVVIRRHDKEIKPLLSSSLESLVKENIRINLQQVLWGIITHDAAVYQFALKQALNNIKRAFNENEPSVQALINQVNALQQVKWTQDKPANGSALPLLNTLIDTQKSGKN